MCSEQLIFQGTQCFRAGADAKFISNQFRIEMLYFCFLGKCALGLPTKSQHAKAGRGAPAIFTASQNLMFVGCSD